MTVSQSVLYMCVCDKSTQNRRQINHFGVNLLARLPELVLPQDYWVFG
jgi:hypothetical protein